ncbi:putative NADH dehydrogenase [ubiquinone] flavoprotein 2, mitochondrial [Wickerhamomyces ciferrii]|uniref:NADH dehydrogenase [ubiquinone] flavoprotein 2, mitochondrial n=1 Tax=Wickerhamomyces ciferrii (strain ATCC 14091 / BCRC 22168 / CBS 111 / JCM 3599 / NBRC 0793 / NRRL Y-1031 F-60-10) TaxID=1206466 RepID=K0KJC8_WICCF|nr:putative NADH dehydrogenase [ubiquinone] flavoprotein 2, mitochondrial [Wickerhamomyces ciferrii]CCH42232.1 putative NADH dehydrogenase [ubiquinone] flavoprotein 2, mitochondrial [Wickerhamomyces ciferrii]
MLLPTARLTTRRASKIASIRFFMGFISIPKRWSHIDAVHRNTKDNNPSVKFEFNDKNSQEVTKIIAKYPEQYKKAAIMPLLNLGQHQFGYCSIGVMNEVARILEVPPMRVYEVASFYTMFHRKPVGQVNVGICTNIACQLRGADDIYSNAKSYCKSEKNKDGFFSLEELECSGACANAPVAEINNIYYEDLDKDSIIKVLDDLRIGKAKPGPFGGKRVSCEPEGEKTSLFGKEAFDIRTVTRDDI